ncbi:hypothetical protein ACFXPX_36765 [Kitasatospora sp. NPDC059146]|uniref:hypothetical protein n=1 Tax=unclassified Kitasatospora TaxID=2633591 RepID=UPI0036A7896E
MPESTPKLHYSRSGKWDHALPPRYSYPGPGTRAPALCGNFVDIYWVREEVDGGGFAGLLEMHREWFANDRSYAPHRPKGSPKSRRLGRLARRRPVRVCPGCRKAFRELGRPRWRALPADTTRP